MGDRSTRSTQSQELLEAGRVFRGWGLCMEFWRLSSIGTWSVEDQLGANGGQGAFFGDSNHCNFWKVRHENASASGDLVFRVGWQCKLTFHRTEREV